ncbi:mCG147085 [Mus musculus]|nr:mCG147085 [Mus musculus]
MIDHLPGIGYQNVVTCCLKLALKLHTKVPPHLEQHFFLYFRFTLCVCVYTCGSTHVCECAWKPEDNLKCYSSALWHCLPFFICFLFGDRVSFTSLYLPMYHVG